MTAPRQVGEGVCKDCATYREKIFTNIQRTCTWTCTAVDPKERCPCRPSHFVPKDTTVRAVDNATNVEKVLMELRRTVVLQTHPANAGSIFLKSDVLKMIDKLQSQQTKEREQG